MDTITSRRNPAVKAIRELKKRAARDTLGLAFIEGFRLVRDALSSGAVIRTLYMSDSFARGGGRGYIEAQAAEKKVKLISLADGVYESVTDTKNPQGLLAVVETFDYSLSDLLIRRDGPRRLLMLDRVADPGNAGAMLRTAEAAAFSGVVLSEGCVDIYEPKTLRAAMGSAFRIPFLRGAGLPETAEILKREGFRIYAAAPSAVSGGGDKRNNCFNGRPGGGGDGDIALIIGGEAAGVSAELLDMCDGVLSIPMRGSVESLNAGVAAGILMYEFVRRELAD